MYKHKRLSESYQHFQRHLSENQESRKNAAEMFQIILIYQSSPEFLNLNQYWYFNRTRRFNINSNQGTCFRERMMK